MSFFGRGFLFTGYSFFCFTLLSLCAQGEAVEVNFASRTYLEFFEDARNNLHAPFYEYVELYLKNLKEGKLSFYAGGWLRYDLKTLSNPEREIDELSYAYLRYAPFEDRSLLFHIGRHHITEGIAAVLVDGPLRDGRFPGSQGFISSEECRWRPNSMAGEAISSMEEGISEDRKEGGSGILFPEGR